MRRRPESVRAYGALERWRRYGRAAVGWLLLANVGARPESPSAWAECSRRGVLLSACAAVLAVRAVLPSPHARAVPCAESPVEPAPAVVWPAGEGVEACAVQSLRCRRAAAAAAALLLPLLNF